MTAVTASQLAQATGRSVGEVACELADRCRAGEIEGREFNGSIVYFLPDGDD